jgi:hypothetical protein
MLRHQGQGPPVVTPTSRRWTSATQQRDYFS